MTWWDIQKLGTTAAEFIFFLPFLGSPSSVYQLVTRVQPRIICACQQAENTGNHVSHPFSPVISSSGTPSLPGQHQDWTAPSRDKKAGKPKSKIT
jgi:hypothetical protein